MRVSAV